jgi:hypothetical protein
MKKSIRLLMGLLVPALMLAGVAVNPVLAQDKAKDAKAAPAAKAEKGNQVLKVLLDNDRVRVTETTLNPGDVGPSSVRGYRVTRSLTGGTIERTWADGKKETITWKPGEVKASPAETMAFANKNVGKAPFVFYTVNLKDAKK